MTPDEKAELRKAAEAALATGEDDAWHSADAITAHGFEWGDAKFIAKASPETLLALLDENARLAAEVERLTEKPPPHCWHCLVQLVPEPSRCESCPDECDDDTCQAEGCLAERARHPGVSARPEPSE